MRCFSLLIMLIPPNLRLYITSSSNFLPIYSSVDSLITHNTRGNNHRVGYFSL